MPGATYVLRPGGYAVIFRCVGTVAVVSTPKGLFLPGGGQVPGESPEDAAIREAKEEGGLNISLGRVIGVADELVFDADEATHYRKRCSFFLAELMGSSGVGEPDHELVWLSPQGAVARLQQGSQRWAVSVAIALRRIAAGSDRPLSSE
jgi:8-oxo-dGTP pyrophosphatase MutT (NUDIX family)